MVHECIYRCAKLLFSFLYYGIGLDDSHIASLPDRMYSLYYSGYNSDCPVHALPPRGQSRPGPQLRTTLKHKSWLLNNQRHDIGKWTPHKLELLSTAAVGCAPVSGKMMCCQDDTRTVKCTHVNKQDNPSSQQSLCGRPWEDLTDLQYFFEMVMQPAFAFILHFSKSTSSLDLIMC